MQEQRKHILGVQANIWTEHMRTEDRVEYMTFPRAAALAEIAWSPADRDRLGVVLARLPAQLARYDAWACAIADSSPRRPDATGRRTSHELKLCTEKLVLSLEDDAPLAGRARGLSGRHHEPVLDLRGRGPAEVDDDRGAVGQVPFNFQIGDDVNKIPLRTPATRGGRTGSAHRRLRRRESRRAAARAGRGQLSGHDVAAGGDAARARASTICASCSRRRAWIRCG